MGCNCGKPKCDGHCNASPAVLQINNPSECVLFHKVEIPASMGNEITIPPEPGLYKNVLLYYEATGNAYFYSSDGIPTPISYTDYTRLTNKPSINGVMLVGNKSLDDLGININDATLTIKQGDTTLGTFSANASENAEINIPASSESILRVRMTGYDENADWYVMDFFNGYNIDYDEFGQNPSGSYIAAKEVPSPVFEDESSGESISLAEIVSAFNAGTRVIFDGLPLGWSMSAHLDDIDNAPALSGDTSRDYLEISGVYTIEDNGAIYSGCAPFPTTKQIAVPFSFFISEDPESANPYTLYVQGHLTVVPPA